MSDVQSCNPVFRPSGSEENSRFGAARRFSPQCSQTGCCWFRRPFSKFSLRRFQVVSTEAAPLDIFPLCITLSTVPIPPTWTNNLPRFVLHTYNFLLTLWLFCKYYSSNRPLSWPSPLVRDHFVNRLVYPSYLFPLFLFPFVKYFWLPI